MKALLLSRRFKRHFLVVTLVIFFVYCVFDLDLQPAMYPKQVIKGPLANFWKDEEPTNNNSDKELELETSLKSKESETSLKSKESETSLKSKESETSLKSKESETSQRPQKLEEVSKRSESKGDPSLTKDEDVEKKEVSEKKNPFVNTTSSDSSRVAWEEVSALPSHLSPQLSRIQSSLSDLCHKIFLMDLGRYNATAVGWCVHLNSLFSHLCLSLRDLPPLEGSLRNEKDILLHGKAKRFQNELLVEWQNLMTFLASRRARGVNSYDLQRVQGVLMSEQRKVMVVLEDLQWDANFDSNRLQLLRKISSEIVRKFQHTNSNCKDNMLWCVLPATGWGSRLSHAILCCLASFGHNQKFALVRHQSLRGIGFMQNYSIQMCSPSEGRDPPLPHWPWKDPKSNSSILNNSVRRFNYDDLVDLNLTNILPKSTPFDTNLRNKLDYLVDDSLAFYVGIFTNLLQTPNEDLVSRINHVLKDRLGLKESFDQMPRLVNTTFDRQRDGQYMAETLVAGIQVRRRDKIKEACLQPLSKYMEKVEHFFLKWDQRTGRQVRRRLFIATDESSVIVEARQTYKNYEIFALTISDIFNSTGGSRIPDESFYELLMTEMQLLSRLDFVVCTFTSNIGRTLYQLRLQHDPQARLNMLSLDVDWFFHGSGPSVGNVAAESNLIEVNSVKMNSSEASTEQSEAELQFRKGDFITVIEVNGGHRRLWFDPVGVNEGLTAGALRSKEGWYPRFKVQKDLFNLR